MDYPLGINAGDTITVCDGRAGQTRIVTAKKRTTIANSHELAALATKLLTKTS